MIDQAIGIIRSRSGASAEEAFDRLGRLSQAENVKLRVVAERLVDEAVRRAKARRSGSAECKILLRCDQLNQQPGRDEVAAVCRRLA